MQIIILWAVVVALFMSVGNRASVYAQSIVPLVSANTTGEGAHLDERQRVLERLQEEIVRIKEKRDQALPAWLRADNGKNQLSGLMQAHAGVKQLEEQLILLERLRDGVDDLEKEQQQTLLEWLQNGIDQIEEKQQQTLVEWLENGPQKTPPADYEQMQAKMQQLEQEQQQMMREWAQAGQQQLTALQSPLITSGSISSSFPPECATHLQEEKAKLESDGYSKEAWLHHVFECDMCCAPLLTDILDVHVSHVIAQPHMVVLFDFDTYTLEDRYHPQLDALMQGFDPTRDLILLIGRASKTGDRAYNIILSGRRAGEVKDYFVDTYKVDESQVSYLFFGYDPPQLTLELADRYGITDDDLASLDPTVKLTVRARINQSVVVVVHKGASGAEVSKPTPHQALLKDKQDTPSPAQASPVSSGRKRQ